MTLKTITEARTQYAEEAGKILSIAFDKPRESTGKLRIKERAPDGLVPFQARMLAAYPTKSLNNRIYTKELLQSVPPLYVGKPFILDHNIEDVDVITGLVTGAKYGLDESADGSTKEGLWLDTLGYMDEKLFAKMKGSKIIPPFIKGVSIGGEGEGDFRADGGIMIKKFLPAEISMTGFPGLPEAHVSQLNRIRESYKSHEDEVKNTKYPVQETSVSLEEAEKQALAEKNRINEGPLPQPDSSIRPLRGVTFPQNDVRPGLPAPTVRTNQVWIQPQPTTSSPGTAAFTVNPQNPTNSGVTSMAATGATGLGTATQTGPVNLTGGIQAGPYGVASMVNTMTAIGSPGLSNLGPNSPQGSYGTSQTIPSQLQGAAPGMVQNMSSASEVIPGTVPGPTNTGPDAQPRVADDGQVSRASTTNMPAGPISLGDANQDVGQGAMMGPRASSGSPMTYVGQMTPGGIVQGASTTAMAGGVGQAAGQAVGAGTAGGPRTDPGYFYGPYNLVPLTPAMGATTTTGNGAAPQPGSGNPYSAGSSSAVAQSTKSSKKKKTVEDTAEDGEEEEEEEEEEGGEAGIDPIRKAAGQGKVGQRAVVNPVTANQAISDVIPIQASAPSILWNRTMDMVLHDLVPKQTAEENSAAVTTKSVTALPSLPFANQYTVDPTADYQRGKQLLKEETEKPSSNMGSPAQRTFLRLMAEKGLR